MIAHDCLSVTCVSAVGESQVLPAAHECELASGRVSAFRSAGVGPERRHDGSIHGQHGLLLPRE